MDERDRMLDSLGFDVADGEEVDWSALTASTPRDKDRALLENLRSLSLMARYYRELRDEDPAARAQALPDDARSTEMVAVATESPDSNLSTVRRWGHLEILAAIGRGTYGDVFRARDTRLNRDVALKIIPAAAVDADPGTSRLAEAERLARVKHPHLVTIHGAEARGNELGLWMEYIQGVTLHELVREQGALSAQEAILLGCDLCGAVAALHAAGLYHRDIKAQNVMREQGGRVVLMDLGAGTDIAASADETQNAAWGHLSGTPMYMAPELLAGHAANTRTEIYSLGVLLYYAVTGTYPLDAQSMQDLKRQHARRAHRHLRDVRPDLPSAFVSVIERAIAADPQQRFASAGEMEQALSAASGLSNGAVDLRPTRAAEERSAQPSSASGQRPLVWLCAVTAVIAIAIALFLWPGLLVSAPYTVTATLQRVGPGADAQLLPGARVAPGDQLYLTFEATRDMHVYVMAEDDLGEAFLLFPLPGHAVGNPLPGEQLHRLPPDQDGQPFSWGVSSAGGTEHLLIVASPDALVEFEQSLAALPAPHAPDAQALPLSQEALEGLRGIGHIMAAPSAPAPATTRPAFAMARQLAVAPEECRGIWVRQIDLVNPGP